ncbi:MAG TPA: hypothetical protein VHQ47_11615 [Phycisphaerae bacterium]|jgi:hypothetical protein|nr:hypothetical protein [Phycisphaerae bacterium]
MEKPEFFRAMLTQVAATILPAHRFTARAPLSFDELTGVFSFALHQRRAKVR